LSDPEPKRALILAGGGLKVAFQAGVLQVWLDEAGQEFHLADGASGGVFNLAMWCTGKTGTEIADAWRQTNPLDFVSVNPRPWVAVSSLERFRKKVLPTWGIDWQQIERPDATFNVYNFSRHELQTRRPDQMNDEWLLACVSLPMWFPPVRIDGDVYIDSVYATDANLEAAIDRGANELWVIWTVSKRGRWRNGFVNQYFQIIENAAVWRLKDLERRIEASNAAISAGGEGEFGQRIELKILYAEVPLHYLLAFSADRLHEAVELGVQQARAWCAENGIPLLNAPPLRPRRDSTHLRFTERMGGTMAFCADTPERGARAGAESGTDLAVRLTVDVGGVHRFLADPRHEAQLTGWVISDALGGRLPVESGVFNLFVHEQNPGLRKMLYRVFFRDRAGHMLTLTGEKLVPRAPAHHPWRDTTTLFTRVLRGRIEPDGDPHAQVAAAGVVRITPPGLLLQLLSFRASGPGRVRAVAGIGLVGRFFAFFVGTLARIYLRR
jgi:predicted acylesterase/phospholipase RssA